MAQDTGVDAVSSSKDALRVETEADTHGTDAATTSKAEDLPETEQPIIRTTEVIILDSCGNVLTDRFYN